MTFVPDWKLWFRRLFFFCLDFVKSKFPKMLGFEVDKVLDKQDAIFDLVHSGYRFIN